ncbi:MAG: addiction module toxin RelE [Nitrospirae bacterium]|nr:addiction module toxin RelE [Nitrospirota bacterium]
MARPLRIEYPGAVYHITSRGNEKKAVFKSDQDRTAFLNALQHVKKRYNWICHAYCLMDNHYHLLIETPDGNLALGMRQINGVYTQLFNTAHGRSGHLFQGRYKSILIQKDSHLLEVCRYVVLNPVRAKMVEAPALWKWSSYRATAGRESAHPCLTTDWVLGQFNGKRGKAEKEYRQFVQWGIGKSVWHEVRGQAILGEEAFADKLADHLRKHKDVPEITRSQRFVNRPALDAIFTPRVLKDKERRNRKIAEAVEKYGYTQRAIADHLGMHFTYISRIMNWQHVP